MAGRRDGSIGLMAEVDRDADMDWKSVVGPLSVVKAGAHLHRYALIAEHVRIDELVSVHRKAIVMQYSHIQTGAIIGNGTLCKVFSNVGPHAIISDGAVVGLRAKVMSHGKVGRNGVVGFYALIGRRVVMEKYVAVSERARVGTGAILSKYSVVQVAVDVPAGLKVAAKQIVIGAPETIILLRMLSEWEFSKRWAIFKIYIDHCHRQIFFNSSLFCVFTIDSTKQLMIWPLSPIAGTMLHSFKWRNIEYFLPFSKGSPDTSPENWVTF